MKRRTHVAHHYVPDFLLKNWHTLPDDKLTQYSWVPGKLDTQRRKAKHVAKEDYLYGTSSVTGELDVRVETEFFTQVIDNPGAPVLRQLCSEGTKGLRESERQIWAQFLVAQMARTPAMVKHFQSAAEKDFREGAQRIADQPGRANFLAYVDTHAPNTGKNIGVEILPEVIGNAKLISAVQAAQWHVMDLSSSSLDLLIGDRPLLIVGPLNMNFLMTLPLTPKHLFCAAFHQGTIDSISRSRPIEIAKTMNKDMVLHAAKYIYATSDLHTPLVRKYLRQT